MGRLDKNPLVANYDGLFCEASGFGRARRVTLLECFASLCGLSASSPFFLRSTFVERTGYHRLATTKFDFDFGMYDI
jgi:hypothetical protein